MTAASLPQILLASPLPDAEVERSLRADETVSIIDPELAGEHPLMAGLAIADGVIVQGSVPLTRELIEAASALRVIGTTGSGFDNIDVSAATARGILVVNGTGIAPHAVAEYAVGAMVAAHRGLLFLHQEVTGGEVQWRERLTRYIGQELTDTTLGVVGYGYIGRLVAAKARSAFGVDVLVFDPFAEVQETDGVAAVTELDELLRRSDTVTVHVPYSPQTELLIGERELALMRPSAVLIDTARGRIVDEDALLSALQTGRLRGAVLDVFSSEPPSPELVARLAATPRLLVTPHVAGVTTRAMRLLAENVVEQVRMALRGDRPTQLVNPEVLR